LDGKRRPPFVTGAASSSHSPISAPAFFAATPSLHVKTTLVLVLIAYHLYCGRLMREFAAGRNRRSHVWYRVLNEVPVILLFVVIFLVVLKPF
jgi:uncharacterized integral membrane protein (TIGR00701 family)